MMSNRRGRRAKSVELTDLYAMKLSSLWLALKQEHLSLWMLSGYFFFEYIRPQALYPVLDVLPWAQLFLIASIMSAIADRSAKLTANIENKLFVLFVFVIILSSLNAFRPALSFDYKEVMGGWIIIYFLVISVVNTEKRLFLFLLLYCLFNFKMAQHGVLSWAQRGFTFESYGLVGAPGWFSNSGEYAIQMLIYGSITIALVVSLKGYWGRNKQIILTTLGVFGFVAVMGANSRGAQLGLAGIGLWFFLKQKNGFKGVLALALVALALFYFLPDEQMDRFREMGNDKDSLQRLAYWEYGLTEVIPKHPVLGVGYHNWLAYALFNVPEGLGPNRTVQESHNIYIQATAELGITGLLVFLLLILFAFVNNARTRALTKDNENKLYFNLSYAFDAGLVGYLISGSFVTVLYYPFFWIQIAMIVMLNNVVSQKQKQKQKQKF